MTYLSKEGGKKRNKDGRKNKTWSYLNLFLQEFTARPDIADDCFLLASRCIRYCPELFIPSEVFQPLVDCSMIGITVQHKYSLYLSISLPKLCYQWQWLTSISWLFYLFLPLADRPPIPYWPSYPMSLILPNLARESNTYLSGTVWLSLEGPASPEFWLPL